MQWLNAHLQKSGLLDQLLNCQISKPCLIVVNLAQAKQQRVGIWNDWQFIIPSDWRHPNN